MYLILFKVYMHPAKLQKSGNVPLCIYIKYTGCQNIVKSNWLLKSYFELLSNQVTRPHRTVMSQDPGVHFCITAARFISG